MPLRLAWPFGTWFLCAAVGCRPEGQPEEAHTTTEALRGWHYVAEVAPATSGVAVELCFDGRPPARLVPIVPEALAHIDALAVTGDGRTPKVRGGAIALDGIEPGQCVRWRVDFDAMAAAEGERAISRLGDSVMVRQSMWLLWPDDVPDELGATIELRLPEGVQASVPWPAVDGAAATYALDATVSRWLGYTVLGKLDVDRHERAGATIEIVRLDMPLVCDRACVRGWIDDAVDTVAMLYGGTYPRAQLQVIVVPVDGGGGTVYFGAAARGGGSSVYLLVDDEATAERLPGGWTTVHELLHHGMPFVDDAWMAEGWVSYYTEVMRTRAGHRSEAAGWWELAEAFARGRSGARGLSLGEASDDMLETHAFQRVYWGGAAIALELDITMRLASGGTRSIDDAVGHLRRCCGERKRRVTATSMLRELDRWYGEPIFTEVATRHLQSREPPDIAAQYARLGIEIGAGTVTFDERHPAAAVRRAIMAPRRGAPGSAAP